MAVRGCGWVAVALTACACSGGSQNAARDAGHGTRTQAPADAAGDIGVPPDAGRDGPGPSDGAPDAFRPEAGSRTPHDGGVDAASTPPPYDGGTDGDGGPRVRTVDLPSRQIGPLTGSPDAIAADDTGVYWLTHENELWMADHATGDVPRRLAAEAGKSIICSGYGRLAVADDQLFWAAEWWAPGPGYVLNSALHRTTKAAEDATLVNNLALSDPISIAISGDDIYWNEGSGTGPDVPSTFVRTLPRGAAPGDNPQNLVSVNGFYQIGGVTVVGSNLYWTKTFLGTTVFTPSLQRADLQALRQASAPPPTPVAARAWLVRGYEGYLYVARDTDLWHTVVTRIPDSIGPGTDLDDVFDDSAVAEIQFLDQWALTSVEQGGCGSLRYTLLAIPTDGSGPAIQLATDLLTPGVLGQGLSFIDAARMLYLVALDDLRAALKAAGG
jgi:hypothetical protein